MKYKQIDNSDFIQNGKYARNIYISDILHNLYCNKR